MTTTMGATTTTEMTTTTMTTTEQRRSAAQRGSAGGGSAADGAAGGGAARRSWGRRRLGAVVVAVAALAAALVAFPRDDDRPVDPSRPDARRAVAAAQAIVPGEVRDVRRDSDNGKWEVTLWSAGGEYEVELDPRDLSLLRIDYD
jgi:hypothetical protein